MRISKVHNIVLEILTKYPETRNSDDILYCYVCNRLSNACAYMSFIDFMKARASLKLPPYETVSRARRKIQAARATLAPVQEVEEKRILNEVHFVDYARKRRI